MSTPIPPLRRSPPRRPLHERSDSHTNEAASPSLRIVGDTEARVYSSTPYPTHPSHVLLPKEDLRRGLVLEDEPFTEHGSTIQKPQQSQGETNYDKHSKGLDVDVYRDGDDEPSSNQSSSGTFLPRSFYAQPFFNTASDSSFQKGATHHKHESDDILELPIVPPRTGALDSSLLPSTLEDTPNPQSVGAKSSETSLSSAGSTGTVLVHKIPRHASYSAFPNSSRTSSSRTNESSTTSQRPTQMVLEGGDASLSQLPPESHRSAFFPTPEGGRASSAPANGPQGEPGSDDLKLQYPIIRPPSVSASWAESSTSVPRRPQRAAVPHPLRWNPHLSTVQSEVSEDVGRGSLGGQGSTYSREGAPDTAVDGPASSSQQLRPVSARSGPREFSASTIRIVEDRESGNDDRPPTVPGSRGSAFSNIFSKRSNQDMRRTAAQSGPGSRGSFLRDSIPAWARIYYARPTSSRGTEDVPINVSRTRSRPQAIDTVNRVPDEMTIRPVGGTGETIIEVRGAPRRKISQIWSPHLWHDRRKLGRRQTIFRPPSLDEEAEGHALSKRNAQVLLFAVGFMFPPAWFIASFLPLPPKFVVEPSQTPRNTHSVELEKALQTVDDARYENARWWRNLNRVLSVAGALVLVAIITLAAVAATS